MVSKAREDLPEPLKPVMTTSLSRGISSVRFLRLCSRAPPILIKSFAMDREFLAQPIHQRSKKMAAWKALPEFDYLEAGRLTAAGISPPLRCGCAPGAFR